MEKTTTPSGSPLHRGRNGRKKTFQCYIVAFPPPVQGGVRGRSFRRTKKRAPHDALSYMKIFKSYFFTASFT